MESGIDGLVNFSDEVAKINEDRLLATAIMDTSEELHGINCFLEMAGIISEHYPNHKVVIKVYDL